MSKNEEKSRHDSKPNSSKYKYQSKQTLEQSEKMDKSIWDSPRNQLLSSGHSGKRSEKIKWEFVRI